MSNAPGSGLPAAGWYANPQDPNRERWWDGNAWTEHYRAKPQAANVVPAASQGPASLLSLACPNCGSQDVKTLKIIHAHGTSTGSGSSTGWVQGTGGQPGGVATFSTRTKNTTEAAREAAAPKKRYNGVALIVIGVVAGAVLAVLGDALGTSGGFGTPTVNTGIGVVLGLAIVLGGVALAMRDFNYNRDVFPGALERWGRSWQCQRCGNVFVL